MLAEGVAQSRGGAASSSSSTWSVAPVEGQAHVAFSRERVWIWPSRSARVYGRLSLTLQSGAIFVSWLPYSAGMIGEDGAFQAAVSPHGGRAGRARTCYAIRPTPATDIEAVTRHAPAVALGSPYLMIVMRSGAVHPPLFLDAAGIAAFFAALREHVPLARAPADPDTYLVAPDGGGGGRGGGLRGEEVITAPGVVSDRLDSCTQKPDPPAPSGVAGISDPQQGVPLGTGDAPWLERSLATAEAAAERALRAASQAARALFTDADAAREELEGELSMNTAMHDLLAGGPIPRARRMHARSRAPQADDEAADGIPRVSATTAPSTVASGVAGSQSGSDAGASRMDEGGSGGGGGGGGGSGGAHLEDTGVGSFELVDEAGAPSSGGRLRGEPAVPLSAAEWPSFLDADGRVVDDAALWRRVYTGGVEANLRAEIWNLLLGVYPTESTHSERAERRAALAAKYAALREQWRAIDGEQAAHWATWRERRAQVEKDVVRTDRDSALLAAPDAPALATMTNVLLTYATFNQDLGYSQGMSDALAPLLLVFRDEAAAFWAFKALMDRIGGVFAGGQAVARAQLAGLRRLLALLDPPLAAALRAAGGADLLCCFRWVLVLHKREWPLAEVPALWEALWANPLTPHLHLFVALVMLERRRAELLQPGLTCGQLHVVCAGLRGTLNLGSVLADAEALVAYAGDAGLACLAPVPSSALVVSRPSR